MSTLHVENLKGLSSGGNANKIIVPSGQTIDASAGTLVPSAGQVIQVKHGATVNTSAFNTTLATGTTVYTGPTITPISTSSKILICFLSINLFFKSDINSGFGSKENIFEKKVL